MNERFNLKKSTEKPNYWVCADTANGIICVFENKNYNDNQQFSLYENTKPDAHVIARAVREMADWLRENHYDKIF